MSWLLQTAAMSTAVHVSFQITFFSGHMPRHGIAGLYGRSIIFGF